MEEINFDNNSWYIACRSYELKDLPLHKTILNNPLVLFRDSNGKAIALFDRCSHRGVPLSKGSVSKDNIVCCYHGWEYNAKGKCVHIPELPAEAPIPAKACVNSYATYEVAGYIWVKLNLNCADAACNFLSQYNNSQYKITYNTADEVKADWFHMMENIIDGAHLSFVHKGSLDSKKNIFYRWSQKFRKKKIDRSEYVITDTPDGFDAQLSDQNKIFKFKVILPSTIMIEMNFGKTEIRIGIHVVPIKPGLCRVEHAYIRNFLKFNMLNFIFKKIALKYLKEDVKVVEYVQNNYEKYGRSWETSTRNDRLPNYLRKAWREKATNLIRREDLEVV